jgi:hypothetical protein
MKKRVLCLALLGVFALGNGPVRAQCFQSGPGPYYATPSWAQKFSGSQRFICLWDWNNQAVLDQETGLVWQRTPEVATESKNFPDAVFACYLTATGGRKGWRLPAPEELLSLIDPAQSNPALPLGHPFQQVFRFYWSATTIFPPTTTTAGAAILASIADGSIITGTTTGVSAGVWCVRGGAHLLTAFGPSLP